MRGADLESKSGAGNLMRLFPPEWSREREGVKLPSGVSGKSWNSIQMFGVGENRAQHNGI